jgi:glycosyltransferase involved in cell wall biosynthesis
VGDGESGVHASSYWWSQLRLAVAAAAAVLVAGVAIGGAVVGAWSLATVAVAGAATLVVSPLVVRRLGAEVARVRGFRDGAARRADVARRRRAGLAGTYVVLSGVPIDDTGGGARCTQIALELLRRRFEVTFVNRFPRYESADLRLRIAHPNLETHELRDLALEAWISERAAVLRDRPSGALVEFPLSEFLPIARRLSAAGVTVVYDLIDDWATSLGADWYSPEVEQAIVDASDRLVTTASVLAEPLQARSGGRPVTVLPNAVNLRLFDASRSYTRPLDLPNAPWVAIYVGALWGEWFDWDLLRACALRYPDSAVVVIGDYRGQCPDRPPNLSFLGLKPQQELPAYLAHADVAIVPWVVNEITRATSPLKVYEYLAMRLPVVAPDLAPLGGLPFVLRARDAEDFVEMVGRAREVTVDPGELEAFLASNSWEARVDALLAVTATQARA